MSKSFLVKSIQYSLLKEFSFFDVREFWKPITYVLNGEELTELDVQKIYSENGDIPVSLMYNVLVRAGSVGSKYWTVVMQHLPSCFAPDSPVVNNLTSIAIDVILEALESSKGCVLESFFDMYPGIIHNILKFYNVQILEKYQCDNTFNYAYISDV